MALIPDKRTPLTLDQAIEAFRGGYRRIMGAEPSRESLACLVAQSALETGNWKSLHCYNFGNVRPGSSWEGDTCQYGCTEVIDGVIKRYRPPQPESTFRAFTSAEEGAAAQVRFFLKRPLAWHWIMQGSPANFVDALHAAHYFTGDLGEYRSAVYRIFKSILTACSVVNGVTDGDRARVAELVRASLGTAAFRHAIDESPDFPEMHA